MRLYLLSFLLIPASACAQDNEPKPAKLPSGFISAQYNDVMSGRALTLTYHQPFGNRGWRGYIGLRYHLHKPKSETAFNDVYTKSFYARNGVEHLGVKMGVEKGYSVFKKYPTELYGFWDVQIAHGALQQSPYEMYDSTNNYIVTVYGTPTGNATYFENNFGLGLRSQVTDRFSYRIFGGGGIDAIIDRRYSSFIGSPTFSQWAWQLGYTFGFGVDYTFK